MCSCLVVTSFFGRVSHYYWYESSGLGGGQSSTWSPLSHASIVTQNRLPHLLAKYSYAPPFQQPFISQPLGNDSFLHRCNRSGGTEMSCCSLLGVHLSWHTGCCRKHGCTQSTQVACGVPDSYWKCTFLLQFSSSLPSCHELMRTVLKVPVCTALLVRGPWCDWQTKLFSPHCLKNKCPFRKHFTAREFDWVIFYKCKANKFYFQ